MNQWKKLKKILKLPLTSKEVEKLIREQMIKVCRQEEQVNLINAKVVEIENCVNDDNCCIVYFWNNIYWEVSANRECIAISAETAGVRYACTKFPLREIDTLDTYLYFSKDKCVRIRGKNFRNLKFYFQ